ncbi:DNA-directed RNA polymerase subunit beta [Candidatus Wolfebacteria bacterium]|nr:DNA-directed RNA polymerase subunit beta [Candidatus Wolfebacteria bacterium]
MPVKIFSSHPGAFIKQPFLAEIQNLSWEWFIKKGLKEIFEEISPIKDSAGEFELYFSDYYFDEPKYDEETAWSKSLTYEAPLRVKAKLINLRNKEIKEQEIYLGDFPIITARGTFIINGVERVVISQLIRSAGIYFTAEAYRGRKLFGAKVIPDRGSWLEFSTDPDGFIGVKIDRHRKAAATDLLRIFANIFERRDLETNEAILNLFKDVDAGAVRFIEATLKKSEVKSSMESYLEIYKRLRPGDLATPENAKHLIDAMFVRNDRYGLSAAGRYKLNSRLEISQEKNNQLLDLDDIVLIIKEIIKLNNDPVAESDDVDHLGNRRVKAVGDLLQGRLRIGMARVRRTILDRMSTLETAIVTPVQLISARPLQAVVREFFTGSQLSQFMDQDNPLAELEHKRCLSSMGPGGLTREHAGFEVRDVHISHYGRICPIETPEGANIGLINRLSNYARVNELGFLETPYSKVKNGKATGEIIWLEAKEEEKYKIAHGGVKLDKNGKIIDEKAEVRFRGKPGTCQNKEVDLIDVSPQQILGVAASMIPFIEHNDANRALMGSNMQRQAVPSIVAQAPLVSTGIEERAAKDSGRLIIADFDGKAVEVDAKKITIEDKNKKKKTYSLNKFKRSNDYTCVSHRPLVEKGENVKKGDVLADVSSTENGILALGQNLLVAFISWEGANFEDAIILSERVVKDDFFTSIRIEDFYCDVRETKLGSETTTQDIPNVGEEKLKNLDEEGIIRIGAEVTSGDILVGKISPKGETEFTSEEKLLRAIFGEKVKDIKDTSLVMPHGKSGRIVGVKIFSRDRGDKLEPGVIKRIQIEVAQLRKVMAGDKLAGRHGNKGVISQIRAAEDMPYLDDGTPVDIILNPLGIASRMNIGQILETHLGIAAKRLGYRAVSPIFSSASEDDIKNELKKAGLNESGKFKLYDGRTGEPFPGEITVGYIYMLKLNHLVEDKIHMRSIGPYSLITQQPLGGKAQFGGQRFGEMEVWALEGYGAAYTLQEMLTIKSDDILGRASAFEAIIKQEEIKTPNIPSAFNVLVGEIKALGIDIETIQLEDNRPFAK